MQTRSAVSSNLTVTGRVARQSAETSFQHESAEDRTIKISVEQLNFYYGRSRALHDITLAIPAKRITAFIGPSGCGKSTLLRSINRMNDIIPGIRVDGHIQLDGEDIYAPGTDVVTPLSRIGMVFQKSNPFPRSIFDNVAYGLRVNNLARSRTEMRDRVEE